MTECHLGAFSELPHGQSKIIKTQPDINWPPTSCARSVLVYLVGRRAPFGLCQKHGKHSSSGAFSTICFGAASALTRVNINLTHTIGGDKQETMRGRDGRIATFLTGLMGYTSLGACPINTAAYGDIMQVGNKFVRTHEGADGEFLHCVHATTEETPWALRQHTCLIRRMCTSALRV